MNDFPAPHNYSHLHAFLYRCFDMENVDRMNVFSGVIVLISKHIYSFSLALPSFEVNMLSTDCFHRLIYYYTCKYLSDIM